MEQNKFDCDGQDPETADDANFPAVCEYCESFIAKDMGEAMLHIHGDPQRDNYVRSCRAGELDFLQTANVFLLFLDPNIAKDRLA